jgi:hypothetical protein
VDKLRPDAPPGWTESEPAAPSRTDTEQELLHRLAAHLRDRRRVLSEDDAPPLVFAPSTTQNPAVAIQHPFAVTVYLAEDEARQEVQDALNDLLTAFDFEVVDSLPPLRGSWYRDFIVLSRRALTSRELGERLQKVERGIELQLLHKQQAEIDSMQGDAVAKLLTALEHTPDALVQIGSVLLVKVDGVPAVRNLTQVELRYLEHNPKLLKSPGTILEALQAVDQPELVDQDS